MRKSIICLLLITSCSVGVFAQVENKSRLLVNTLQPFPFSIGPIDWYQNFRLQEGEVLKYIPPEDPNKVLKGNQFNYYAGNAMWLIEEPSLKQVLTQDLKAITNQIVASNTIEPIRFDEYSLLFTRLLKEDASFIQIDDSMKELNLRGTWVVDTSASPMQLAKAMEAIIEKLTSKSVAIYFEDVETEIISVTGEYAYRPHDNFPYPGDWRIALSSESPVPIKAYGKVGFATVGNGLRMLEHLLDMPVLYETSQVRLVATPEDNRWKKSELVHAHLEVSPEEAQQHRDQVLAYLAEQTSLEFTIETRSMRHWRVKVK